MSFLSVLQSGIGYYGVFQALHVLFNVLYLSGLRPFPDFPWPPVKGWHPQATAFPSSLWKAQQGRVDVSRFPAEFHSPQ